MHCEEARRAIDAGEESGELGIHLSACVPCRLLEEDAAQLKRAFARARTEWAPSPSFHVRLPAAPWKKLAIAACLLVVPMASWALASLRPARPAGDLHALIDPHPAAAPTTDREVLATLFLEETQP